MDSVASVVEGRRSGGAEERFIFGSASSTRGHMRDDGGFRRSSIHHWESMGLLYPESLVMVNHNTILWWKSEVR